MGNDRDTFPIDEMYEFLYKSAVCASKCERKRIEKEKGKIPTKRKRVSAPKSGIVLNTSRDCIMCKTSKHPLFMCEIQAVPVLKRIEAIKNVKLCYNCLRSHRACKFSNCTICQKTSKYTLTRYTSMMIFFPKKKHIKHGRMIKRDLFKVCSIANYTFFPSFGQFVDTTSIKIFPFCREPFIEPFFHIFVRTKALLSKCVTHRCKQVVRSEGVKSGE